ncbi:MAG: hypothetical protein VR70_08680 [Rhodospirillaceae bacterium BRH_c57]|nr:MAG: hypothetical protein VR70_08680 [Rhodospirillaceae bacterium BRH_c57]
MSPPFPLSPLLVLNTLLLAACAGPAVPDTPRTAQGPGGSGSVAALESLDAAGVSALEAYAVAAPNKAFAMASDGAWGWQAGAAGVTEAEQQALERCAAVSTSGACQVVAWDAAADWAASSTDTQPFGATPPLDDPGVAAFQTFLAMGGNKAFAVSPDGAWGWRASTALPLEDVQQQARDNCARHGDGCTVVVTAPDVEALAALPR